MINEIATKKIVLLFMYIILISIFIFFPTNEKTIIENTNNNKLETHTIYLLDNDNYVSKVNIYYDEKNIINEIEYKIDYLINGIDNNIFYPLIPKNTKLNNVSVDKDNVYLDFNENILNIPNDLTISMIESIIYSLTDINGINNIYIKVNNTLLEEINNIKLEYPLTRNYGINKKYYIDSLNNINKTTIVFYKNVDNNEYYVPVTIINNNSNEKIDIILEELKSSINSQDNLNGLINKNLNIEEYSIENNTAKIVFNEYLYTSNDQLLNDKINNVISYSIMENYNVDSVQYNINNN